MSHKAIRVCPTPFSSVIPLISLLLTHTLRPSSTRDLRSHNHYVPPPVSPTQPDRPPPPPTTYLPKPSLPTTPKPSFSPRSTLTPGLAGSSRSSAGISHPPSSPARVSIAPVGVRSASSLAVGGGRGAGVWKAESVTPRCPACENPVYFAEQVCMCPSFFSGFVSRADDNRFSRSLHLIASTSLAFSREKRGASHMRCARCHSVHTAPDPLIATPHPPDGIRPACDARPARTP